MAAFSNASVTLQTGLVHVVGSYVEQIQNQL